MSLLVGHDSLLMDLRCDARDPCFYPEGIKRGGFNPPGDDAECSVLVAGPVGLGPARFARLGQCS